VRFETTSWSLIVQATAESSTAAREGLARLFETYWPPVYTFIRRKGHSAADAEDLTQGYFARFLEKDYLADFRPEAGRFRTFIRATVAHFLANERDRERAQKRGGGRVPVAIDAAAAEERLRLEPADRLTPEAIFERQWAASVLAACLERLRVERAAAEGPQRFERLKAFLGADGPDASYEQAAHELGLTASAVRVAVHRLRKRFGAVLRDEVARTVASASDVDAEIRWMLEAVRGSR
jgi:RNA polymerase sigma factor (sigma-70 family)